MKSEWENNPVKLGVTGGIGSGKSVVCTIFKALEVPVYDADTRAKALYSKNDSLKRWMVDEFGSDIYRPDGELDRTKLSKLVFDDSSKLEKLNKRVHPLVAVDYDQWIARHKTYPLLVREAALMFESGAYKAQDYVLTVTAPMEIRINRVIQRDPQRSRSEVESIISKQMSDDEKIKKSDFVVVNDEKSMLIPQVLSVWKKLMD